VYPFPRRRATGVRFQVGGHGFPDLLLLDLVRARGWCGVDGGGGEGMVRPGHSQTHYQTSSDERGTLLAGQAGPSVPTTRSLSPTSAPAGGSNNCTFPSSPFAHSTIPCDTKLFHGYGR